MPLIHCSVDVPRSLLFSFFFSSPSVVPRFIFPLPSQDRKFIVKADYSSIYPLPRSSALTVFRLAAGSYRLTRLQPNIHTRLTLFISCNSQVFVLMPLADSCGWEMAAEVPSRFDAARGIMSHSPPQQNQWRHGRMSPTLTQSLRLPRNFDRCELQGGEQRQQAEALRGDLHGDRHIGVHLWQCVSMTSPQKPEKKFPRPSFQSDRLAIFQKIRSRRCDASGKRFLFFFFFA